MSDSVSVQSILDAAEQAAAVGDIAAAERLLRQVVQLQEAQLGPRHPDLANTLNNLGVVCEKTGQLDEAEDCYRRAYEIAAAAYEPDHLFVATSRKNLADFCEARGRPVERPAAVAAVPAASPPMAVLPPTVEPASGDVARSAAKQPGFPIAISKPLMIGLVVVVVVAVLAIAMRRPSPGAPAKSASPAPPPAAAAPAIESAATRAAAANAAPPAAIESGPSKEAAPTVAQAQVCRGLSTTGSPDWRCEQVGSPVARGSLVYYTRIKAASATTVEHRWYHGDDLQQRVRLDVAANSDPGYRTYSRLAVSAAGRWRVEVRTTDGTLLHEERFDVR